MGRLERELKVFESEYRQWSATTKNLGTDKKESGIQGETRSTWE